MKKSYWFTAAFALITALSSCSKSDSNNTQPTNYKIDGVHDITLQPLANPYGRLTLDLSYIGNIQEYVALSLEGIPEGCAVKMPAPGGYPEFTSDIYFNDTAATPGTYMVKLICEGSGTGRKSYDFKLVLQPEPDFGSAFLGSYTNTSNYCTNGSFTATITAGNKINEIVLDNIDNAGTILNAEVAGDGKSIVIPYQTINGVTYQGSTFLFNSTSDFTVSYTKWTSNGSDICGIHFRR